MKLSNGWLNRMKMNKMPSKFSEKKMKEVTIIGILRGFSKEKILSVISIYAEAGFSTIEITMNTQGACQIISDAVQSFGADLNVGAGTVRNMRELNEALSAGAQFIVTPIFQADVVKECVNAQIPIFPGAYTPTEVYNAWEAGATAVKVFPTTTGGIDHIKAIQAPLDMIPLIPTGGITTNNLTDFLDIGVYGLGVGSQLFSRQVIEERNWSGLKDALNKFKKAYDNWYDRHSAKD